MIITLDLHIHSTASFDSILSVKVIPKVLKMRGFSGFALTDHDSTDNLEEAEFYAKANGLIFIHGIEKKTDRGDVVGLFVERNVTAAGFDEAVAEIREMGGIAVLPHPFRSHATVGREDWTKVDAIEVVNGRSPDDNNARSAIEAAGMIGVGGSDAHVWWELGRVRTMFICNGAQQVSVDLLKRCIKDKRVTVSREKDFDYRRYLWAARYGRLIRAAKKRELRAYGIGLLGRILHLFRSRAHIPHRR